MKKLKSTIVVLLVFSSTLITGAHIVEADSNDYIRLSSGAILYSPLPRRIYNSRFLTLNFTFDVGMGIRYSLNYTIDGKYEGPIPLVVKNPTELHVIYKATGFVELPELSEGSHRLTIHVLCSVSVGHRANPPGAPFKPTYPGSTDYVASWADTVKFTIDTQLQEDTIPEFSSGFILPLFIVSTLSAVIIIRRVKKRPTRPIPIV